MVLGGRLNRCANQFAKKPIIINKAKNLHNPYYQDPKLQGWTMTKFALADST